MALYCFSLANDDLQESLVKTSLKRGIVVSDDHSFIVLNMAFIDRGLTWMLPCMCCTSLPSSLSHLAFSNSASCLISFEFVLFTCDNFIFSCSSSSAVRILYPHLTRPPGRGLTADPLEDELDVLSFRAPRLPDLQQARLPLQRTFHLQKNIFVKSAKETMPVKFCKFCKNPTMRVEIRQTGIFSASSSVFTIHWHHDLHHCLYLSNLSPAFDHDKLVELLLVDSLEPPLSSQQRLHNN